jgi:hypothetical protein
MRELSRVMRSWTIGLFRAVYGELYFGTSPRIILFLEERFALKSFAAVAMLYNIV